MIVQFTQMNLAISSESLELLLRILRGTTLCNEELMLATKKWLIRKWHLFDHFHSRVLYKIRGSVRFQGVYTPVHHLGKVRGMASWAIWPLIAWKRPKGSKSTMDFWIWNTQFTGDFISIIIHHWFESCLGSKYYDCNKIPLCFFCTQQSSVKLILCVGILQSVQKGWFSLDIPSLKLHLKRLVQMSFPFGKAGAVFDFGKRSCFHFYFQRSTKSILKKHTDFPMALFNSKNLGRSMRISSCWLMDP